MKLLTGLHFICLFLMLADLVMMLFWGISYRGQVFEVLLMAVFILTPFINFFFFRKRLSRGWKNYFRLYPIYAALCVVAWFGEKILFVIIASPVIIPLMYSPVMASNREYTIRSGNQSLIGSECYLLSKNYFLFEQKIGLENDEWWAPNCATVQIKAVKDTSDLHLIQMEGCGKDSTLLFTAQPWGR